VWRARLAALSRWAKEDPVAGTARARQAFKDSFANGGGHQCKVCPRIDIPPDLPEAERLRRAAALRKLHFIRLRGSQEKAR